MGKSIDILEQSVRLHFAIAHYYDATGSGRHGSLSPDPKARIEALRETVLQIHRLFGEPAAVLNHHKRQVEVVRRENTEVTISICITGNKHILDDLEDLKEVNAFKEIECNPIEPKHLGFECHRVLEKSYTKYDYNCYLEDDIVISDADFFKKMNWFNRCFGNEYLLQPNRIETSLDLKNIRRFYVDGDYNPPATELYRKSMDKEFCMEYLGTRISFRQPINTHSGCFFLNKEQSEGYFTSGHWNKEETSFHGALESAATLGVMKQFQIIKPAISNGDFLTVEHAGRNFIGIIQS